MTVNTMMKKLLKPFSLAVLLAFVIGGITTLPVLAQEYKESYNAAIEAAKAKDYTTAYSAFVEAAKLADEAGDKEIAQRARKVAAQIDYNTGKQLVANENFDEGLKRFEQGIALFPQYSNNYSGKALALKKLNRDDDAIQAYQELIDYGKANNVSQAVREGEKGIRDHYIYLASSALGRSSEPTASDARAAIGYIEKLQEFVEPDADIYFYLAAANHTLGNYEEAIQYADQALQLHSGSRSDAAKIHFVKGEALMYNGNTAAAKESFQSATFGSYKSLAEHYLETL
jgi:tetratricopeptide (TPR) repeat protein